MDFGTQLKEFLKPKTLHGLSYGTAILWTICAPLSLGVFADIDINEPRSDFQCADKIESKELNTGKCFELYEKRFNEFGIPVYAFVIVNFVLVEFVTVIYYQFVRSRINKLLRATDAERQLAPSPTGGNKLFMAYCIQLFTRFVLGILFIVLQTVVLYNSNFSSNYKCNLTSQVSHAKNSSSAIVPNSTQAYVRINEPIRKTFGCMQ